MTIVKASAIINIKTIEGSTYMNKKEEYQEIYINLDDSGKLTKKGSFANYLLLFTVINLVFLTILLLYTYLFGNI